MVQNYVNNVLNVLIAKRALENLQVSNASTVIYNLAIESLLIPGLDFLYHFHKTKNITMSTTSALYSYAQSLAQSTILVAGVGTGIEAITQGYKEQLIPLMVLGGITSIATIYLLGYLNSKLTKDQVDSSIKIDNETIDNLSTNSDTFKSFVAGAFNARHLFYLRDNANILSTNAIMSEICWSSVYTSLGFFFSDALVGKDFKENIKSTPYNFLQSFINLSTASIIFKAASEAYTQNSVSLNILARLTYLGGMYIPNNISSSITKAVKNFAISYGDSKDNFVSRLSENTSQTDSIVK